LECGKREAEDIGGIVRIAGEMNSVKGMELRLLWLKIEGFGERIEDWGLRRPWRVREAEAREEGFGKVSGEDEREEERKKEKRNKIRKRKNSKIRWKSI
jgi:hypothetical protein